MSSRRFINQRTARRSLLAWLGLTCALLASIVIFGRNWVSGVAYIAAVLLLYCWLLWHE
jgi:hypothetical protein